MFFPLLWWRGFYTCTSGVYGEGLPARVPQQTDKLPCKPICDHCIQQTLFECIAFVFTQNPHAFVCFTLWQYGTRTMQKPCTFAYACLLYVTLCVELLFNCMKTQKDVWAWIGCQILSARGPRSPMGSTRPARVMERSPDGLYQPPFNDAVTCAPHLSLSS